MATVAELATCIIRVIRFFRYADVAEVGMSSIRYRARAVIILPTPSLIHDEAIIGWANGRSLCLRLEEIRAG